MITKDEILNNFNMQQNNSGSFTTTSSTPTFLYNNFETTSDPGTDCYWTMTPSSYYYTDREIWSICDYQSSGTLGSGSQFNYIT